MLLLAFHSEKRSGEGRPVSVTLIALRTSVAIASEDIITLGTLSHAVMPVFFVAFSSSLCSLLWNFLPDSTGYR